MPNFYGGQSGQQNGQNFANKSQNQAKNGLPYQNNYPGRPREMKKHEKIEEDDMSHLNVPEKNQNAIRFSINNLAPGSKVQKFAKELLLMFAEN